MAITQAVTKWGIRAAGAAGAGIVLYDAHKEGEHYSKKYRNKKDASAALYWFDNSRNLNSPSHFNMELKDKLFEWEISENIRGFFNSGIGYAKGFGEMLCSDIVPLGLSAAAMFTKGVASKVSGAALGVYGLYAFAKNVCGLGVKQK